MMGLGAGVLGSCDIQRATGDTQTTIARTVESTAALVYVPEWVPAVRGQEGGQLTRTRAPVM